MSLMRLFAVAVLVIGCSSPLVDREVPAPYSCPPAPTPSPLPSIWAHKVTLESISGTVDLPLPYVAGSIEIFVVEGCDGDALLRTYGFAEFRHKYDCPCTPVQLAAGLDRAFIVTVPFGSEKATVVRLAGDRGSFRYVGLVWVDQTSLA